MSSSPWLRTLVVSGAILLVAVLICAALWLMIRLQGIVLLLLLAGLLSVALMPAVDYLDSFAPLPRPVAVVLVFLAVMLVLAGIVLIVAPPLVTQANALVERLPAIVQTITGPNSPVTELLNRFGISLDAASATFTTQAQEVAKAAVGNAAVVVRDLTAIVVGIIVVAVVSFYFLNEGHAMRAKLEQLVPDEQRGLSDFVVSAVISAVGGYVRAQLIMAAMVGVLAGLSAWAIGISYPLIIGVLASVFELIPFFGPTLGAIPAVAIAAFQGEWVKLGLIVAAFIVIQQIESNIVGPRITAHSVGLHPLVVILAVLVGIELAGVWGALFATPAAGVLVSVGRRLWRANRDRARTAPA